MPSNLIDFSCAYVMLTLSIGTLILRGDMFKINSPPVQSRVYKEGEGEYRTAYTYMPRITAVHMVHDLCNL